LGGREVGFALAEMNMSGSYIIDRVGVHPKFRRVGIGRKIIERITLEAATENINKVIAIVPSYIIDDNEDPWNIEQWLWKLGFKAGKVITDHFHRYNQDYDGYLFQRMKP
jgi:GNAT superfamily N-acetyltransferase